MSEESINKRNYRVVKSLGRGLRMFAIIKYSEFGEFIQAVNKTISDIEKKCRRLKHYMNHKNFAKDYQ